MLTITTAPHLYIRRPSPTTAEFTVTTCPPPTLPLRLLLLAIQLARLLLAAAAILALYVRFCAPPPSADHTDDSDVVAATAAVILSNTTNPLLLLLRLLLPQSLLPASIRPSTTTTTTTTSSSSSSSSSPSDVTTLPSPMARTQGGIGEVALLARALLRAAALSAPGAQLSRLAWALPDWAAAAAAAGALYVAAVPALHRTESVLVLRGLGIQTTAAGGGPSWWSWWGGWCPGSGSGSGSESRWWVWWSWWLRCWSWSWWPWSWWTAATTTTRFIPTEKIRDVLINEAFRGFEVRYYLIVVVEGEEDVVVLFPRLLPRRRIVEAVWRGIRGCLFEKGGEG